MEYRTRWRVLLAGDRRVGVQRSHFRSLLGHSTTTPKAPSARLQSVMGSLARQYGRDRNRTSLSPGDGEAAHANRLEFLVG
jgi:hypothetical protein